MKYSSDIEKEAIDLSTKWKQRAAAAGFYIARSPVLMEGSIELQHYYRQQSICNNYHRYGNLGIRAAGYQIH